MVFLNILLRKENIKSDYIYVIIGDFYMAKKKSTKTSETQLKGQLPKIFAANMINRGLLSRWWQCNGMCKRTDFEDKSALASLHCFGPQFSYL